MERPQLRLGHADGLERARGGAIVLTSEDGSAKIGRTEWVVGEVRRGDDLVAHEEPLELRLGSLPLAVLMRTPGHDEELAWGFCATERIVDHPRDIQSVRHCTTVEDPEAEDNVVTITPRPEAKVDVERLRRNTFASSSCGICGKASIAAVRTLAAPLRDATCLDASVAERPPKLLRQAQPGFARTGGLHAAGLFTPRGELVVAREDVGRHNAVDKVVGHLVRQGRGLAGHVLVISGRISFEIAQKAATAGIPIVVAVSAPSSLAVRLGRELELTLVGFARGERLCVYSGEQRLNFQSAGAGNVTYMGTPKLQQAVSGVGSVKPKG